MNENDWAQKAAEEIVEAVIRRSVSIDYVAAIIRARYQEWRREHGIPYWIQNNLPVEGGSKETKQ